ncbi:hypothetical protein GCM10025856_00820 [Methylophaga marina]|uniref:Uncharacterized protein n=1 Tax=Methylophaga marina TaxID=45495 RepID=A0ABP3DH51_9GAMM|nr:hypothetical protein [Methylophaga marina]BDZ72363.1 hypothetical protein GCM10025856_00820 [Methylophaga marina]
MPNNTVEYMNDDDKNTINNIIKDIFRYMHNAQNIPEINDQILEIYYESETLKTHRQDISVSGFTGFTHEDLSLIWEEVLSRFKEGVENKNSSFSLLLFDYFTDMATNDEEHSNLTSFYLLVKHTKDPNAVYKITPSMNSEVALSHTLKSHELCHYKFIRYDLSLEDQLHTDTKKIRDILTEEILDDYLGKDKTRLLSQFLNNSCLTELVELEKLKEQCINEAGEKEFQFLDQFLSAAPLPVIEILANENTNLTSLKLYMDTSAPLLATFILDFEDGPIHIKVKDILKLHPMTYLYSSYWNKLLTCTTPSLKKIYYDALIQMFFLGEINLKLIVVSPQA